MKSAIATLNWRNSWPMLGGWLLKDIHSVEVCDGELIHAHLEQLYTLRISILCIRYCILKHMLFWNIHVDKYLWRDFQYLGGNLYQLSYQIFYTPEKMVLKSSQLKLKINLFFQASFKKMYKQKLREHEKAYEKQVGCCYKY